MAVITNNFIERARTNNNFRQILHTGRYSQLVAMSIQSGGEIGEEVHPETDQIILIVSGQATALLDKDTVTVSDQDMVFVPAGSLHNVTNTGSGDLKLLSIYSPPEHAGH